MSGTGMGRLAVATVGALATWAVAPWVSMAVHGTVDRRTIASWRVEGGEQGPADGTMPGAWRTIPGPRDTARSSATGSPTSP